MRKTTFVLMALCFLAGCEGLNLEEGVRVDLRSGEELPVKVKPQQAEGLPVTLNV